MGDLRCAPTVDCLPGTSIHDLFNNKQQKKYWLQGEFTLCKKNNPRAENIIKREVSNVQAMYVKHKIEKLDLNYTPTIFGDYCKKEE